MNSVSLARFACASAKVATSLRGTAVRIGDATYQDVPVFHGSATVENDRGGQAVVRTMVVHLPRSLAVEPAVGDRVTELCSGITGEIYEIAGRGLPYHILRVASRPDLSA